MQPYLFPYLGYFQLINLADLFVIYDDVSYIKQGWINRNNILVNGKKLLFSVPLKDASSFTMINQTSINLNIYIKWKNDFFKTLKLNYGKAPNFQQVMVIIEEVFGQSHSKISELAISSIKSVCSYLGISTKIDSSSKYPKSSLKGQERLISICGIEGSDSYINAIGGMELYSRELFKTHNIDLYFIKSELNPYKQFENHFVPALSIIDVLMFNTIEETKEMLNQCILI